MCCPALYPAAETNIQTPGPRAALPLVRISTDIVRESYTIFLLKPFSIYRTQEDLLTLIDAHDRITKHCSDPTGALEYIAGTAGT